MSTYIVLDIVVYKLYALTNSIICNKIMCMSIKEIKLPLMVEHAFSPNEFAGPLTLQMVASVGNNVKCQTRIAIP